MRAFHLMAGAILLTACATAPPPVWMRTDGRSAVSDPALAQQFQIDKTICLGDREKADLSGVTVSNGGIAGLVASQNRTNAADAVFTGCMAQKGYMLVAADQVEAQRAQFAAIAAQQQAQQSAQTQPPRRQ